MSDITKEQLKTVLTGMVNALREPDYNSMTPAQLAKEAVPYLVKILQDVEIKDDAEGVPCVTDTVYEDYIDDTYVYQNLIPAYEYLKNHIQARCTYLGEDCRVLYLDDYPRTPADIFAHAKRMIGEVENG